MTDENIDTLDAGLVEQVIIKRRKLLPWWIRFFCWVFMLMGLMVPLVLVFGVFGSSLDLSLYGLETQVPISVMGLIISALFALKFLAAFGLWTEKDWAIKVGMADAIVGIVICSFTMLVIPLLSGMGLISNFRLELILLILYLIRLLKIKDRWEQNRNDQIPKSNDQ